MSFTTQAVAGASWVIGLFIFVVWAKSLAPVRMQPADDKGRVVSYVLLALYVFVPSIFANHDRNQSHLVTQGLDVQNVIQLVDTMIAVAWAVWLLATRKVIASTFVTGVNFWIGLILALYGLSTIWSLWPSLTAFRTMELSAFWVLSAHLFSGRPPLARLSWCLLGAALLMLVEPFSYLVQHSGMGIYEVFIKIRLNDAGLVTGALLVIVFYRLMITGDMRSIVFIILSLALFAWFASLGSFIALFFATMALLVFRYGRHLGRITQLLIIAYVLPLIGFFFYELVYQNPDAAAWLAWASGKEPANITNATGRAELWQQILEVARNNAFGYGFAAGERLLYQLLASVPGHQANQGQNAHNGFLAAWLAAGWFGGWAVVFMFAGAIFDAVRRSYNDCSFMLPIIIFLLINNLTYAGVGGGVFNPGWFLIMVLACAGSIPETTRGVDKLRHFYRLSGAVR
jgi:exopolysaccharide production protein ExoQ